jgi:hypothetical protein
VEIDSAFELAEKEVVYLAPAYEGGKSTRGQWSFHSPLW